MNILFWLICAADAIFFAVILITSAASPGATSSGGREMAMFFFGIVPLVALGLTALLFYLSRGLFWKYLSLALVLGPGLFYANLQIRNLMIDYRVRQNELGRGYFKEAALKSMGAAVVQGDLPTLDRLAPGVSLNTAGDRGMTLIRLAAERVPRDDVGTPQVQATVAVVEELLRLGAAPDPALSTALRTDDPSLLQALLAHGANPNGEADNGGPVVFQWLRVMPAGHLTLLIGKGLDVNVIQYRTPLALSAALDRRFDLVLLLARSGADLRVPRDDGRNMASEIASHRAEAEAENREPPAELGAIEAILSEQMQGPT